jgi:hypothetical protein
MELELFGLQLPTHSGETSLPKPSETTVGSHTEERSTQQTTSLGSTFPATRSSATPDLPHQTPWLLETKLMEPEHFGLPLHTLLKETFPERPLETAAGTLMEVPNTPPTISLGSVLKTLETIGLIN